jgi:hypothetical protein
MIGTFHMGRQTSVLLPSSCTAKIRVSILLMNRINNGLYLHIHMINEIFNLHNISFKTLKQKSEKI